MSLVVLPRQVIVDINGAPRVAAQLAFYQPGTVTPITVYTTGAYGPTLTNPVESLGSGFFPAVYINPSVNATYKLVALDADDAVLYTEDDIPTEGSQLRSELASAVSGSDGARLVGYRRTETNSVARNAYVVFGEQISATDFASLNDAVIAAGSTGRRVMIPNGTYALGAGATGLTPGDGCWLDGESLPGVLITYTGTGIAIDAYGKSSVRIEHLSLTTTQNAATHMRFGNASQKVRLNDLELLGNIAAGNTGTAILLQAGAPGAFSGHLQGDHIRTLGTKFGLRVAGTDIGTQTWTTFGFRDCFFLGRSSGIIAGSRGIWFDAFTNGIGCYFKGGTVEAFDVGLLHEAGGTGFDFEADLEGNNTPFTIARSTFNGRISLQNAGRYYRGASNGSTNMWLREDHENGVRTVESYYDQQHASPNHGGAATRAVWGRYPDGSGYLDAVPAVVEKFVINMDDSTDQTGIRNYTALCGHRQTWNSVAPGSGTWTQGDVVWNTGVAAGGSPGWVCTTSGSPGVWKAMGNVAA